MYVDSLNRLDQAEDKLMPETIAENLAFVFSLPRVTKAINFVGGAIQDQEINGDPLALLCSPISLILEASEHDSDESQSLALIQAKGREQNDGFFRKLVEDFFLCSDDQGRTKVREILSKIIGDDKVWAYYAHHKGGSSGFVWKAFWRNFCEFFAATPPPILSN